MYKIWSAKISLNLDLDGLNRFVENKNKEGPQRIESPFFPVFDGIQLQPS
jgi:hypothetical protein